MQSTRREKIAIKKSLNAGSKSTCENFVLYNLVFKSKLVRIATAALLFSICLQPATPVFANEESVPEPETVEVAPDPVEEVVVVTEPDPEPAEPVADDEVVADTVNADSPENETDETAAESEPIIKSDSEAVKNIDNPDSVDYVNDATTSTTVTSVSDSVVGFEPAEETLTTDKEVSEDAADATTTSAMASTTQASTPPTNFSSTTISSSTAGGATDLNLNAQTGTSTATATSTDSRPTTTNSLSSTTAQIEVVSDRQEGSTAAESDNVIEAVDEEVHITPADDADDVVSLTFATTSQTVATKTVYVQERNDSNWYQFGTQECVSVGDGSYYCTEQTEVPAAQVRSDVIAELDAEGDYELYHYRADGRIQLTDNQYDDRSPYHDQVSETVVWHRLVEGVYQIVSFDFDTQTETVLTNSRTNNMEPTRSGEVTVWQRWIGDNWEIVMHENGDEKVLTTNTLQDVAPHVRGEYVIWNTINPSGDKDVTVYEIESGLISTIDDRDGGQVTNPRFVLVYDTEYANGDVITKGYDPETGELVPLSAAPAELPPEIPEPDQTGEIRALISTKPTNLEEDDGELETGNDTNTDAAATSSSTTTSSDTLDLNLEPEATTTEAFTLTEYDLVVTAPTTSTSSQSDISTNTEDSVE